jgi:transposase-like protein
MSKGIRFTDEFKQDAVAHGYAVSEVAERPGDKHPARSHDQRGQ